MLQKIWTDQQMVWPWFAKEWLQCIYSFVKLCFCTLLAFAVPNHLKVLHMNHT